MQSCPHLHTKPCGSRAAIDWQRIDQDAWGCNEKLQSLYNVEFSSISLSSLPHLTALLQTAIFDLQTKPLSP